MDKNNNQTKARRMKKAMFKYNKDKKNVGLSTYKKRR